MVLGQGRLTRSANKRNAKKRVIVIMGSSKISIKQIWRHEINTKN
jgi:hypothetical protein